MRITRTLASLPSRMKDVTEAWHFRHIASLRKGQTQYIDPVTGYTVFNEYFHVLRGRCCGNICRHCPYDYVGVISEDTAESRGNPYFTEEKPSQDTPQDNPA